ncbi:MAG TPA: hypothetical protein PKJ60_10690, partial [Ruminococcus sp.]|nr:hypothetical protein [Ruminococcus sp.]
YRLGICILMIHHMRKAKDDNPFNMMTGSTGIGGTTDGNFALKETKCGSGKAIAIRCTEEESRRVHELAERHGLKLNDFVMRCALGKKSLSQMASTR